MDTTGGYIRADQPWSKSGLKGFGASGSEARAPITLVSATLGHANLKTTFGATIKVRARVNQDENPRRWADGGRA